MNIQSVINKLLRIDPNMKPNLCYSQNGEDLILNRLLKDQKKRVLYRYWCASSNKIL